MARSLWHLLYFPAALIGGWIYERFLRLDPDAGSDSEILLRELPKVFRALKAANAEGSFAVFSALRTAGTECAFIQFSVEKGRAGVDWVLSSQPNLDDKDQFLGLAKSLGHEPEVRSSNGVQYLRVEHGDLPKLAGAALESLYGLRGSDKLTLQIDGFRWSTSANAV